MFVYILASKPYGTLYVGVSNDLIRRVYEHRGKITPGFTSRYGENFGSQAKRHLRKYNGIPKDHIPLFLKECEFRFNEEAPTEPLTLLKKWKRKHLI